MAAITGGVMSATNIITITITTTIIIITTEAILVRE